MIAACITPHLYQGMQPDANDYRALQAAGITDILSMNAENPFLGDAKQIFGNEHVCFMPWRDDMQPKPISDFATMEGFFLLLPTPHRLYVHCSAGINRSAIGAIWYLMAHDNTTWDEAVRLLHASNPNAYGYQVAAYKESVAEAEKALLGRQSVQWRPAGAEEEPVS